MGVFAALAMLCAYFAFVNSAVSVTSTTKKPVVQDPAFIGVGTQPGLLIWRIEVSLP